MAALVILISGYLVFDGARNEYLPGGFIGFVLGSIDLLIAPVFAVVGAVIIAHQPRNIIGWLLAVPALGDALVGLIGVWTASFETAPETVSVGLLLALWLENWSWLIFIFPIFHLLQVFPSGRVLTPRWRWLAYLEISMIVVFIGLITFSPELGVSDESGEVMLWAVDNPIGFLREDFWEGAFSTIWSLGLLVLVIGGGVSSVLRFRRARAIERQQLKWLLYVLVLWATVYAVSVFAADSGGWNFGGVMGVLFILPILLIPIVIGISVLRYRLFDIDLIIRRTLVYGLLTALLTAGYFGSVVVLQSLFRTEGNSSLSVAASTLLITASFTPLRRRVQTLIDRRLFRSKYNTQLVIERFGGSAQNEANLETLTADLLGVVTQTIQPRSGALWIRDPG